MATDAPTGRLRGSAHPGAGQVAPWSSFTSQVREHVPELRWPRSNVTYERMLSDSQVWALYTGWVLPAEAYVYWVDPNGNDPGRVAMLAEDLGLPVGAPETEPDAESVERTSLPDEFDFGDMLHEALFAPVFGHYYFEWAGELDGNVWRITDLAPLHPATIGDVQSSRDGRLQFVRQASGASFSLMGGTVWASDAPRIGPERLVPFVWWPDAQRRWLGRSLLRSQYRSWLCKDVLIRVDVTNHERAGGVPWIETDERYEGNDLADLQRLAAEFRVDEDGGAALPPGALLRLAKVAGSDVIGSIRYHDEQMAAVWHSMVRTLAQTPNGSRALGGTFADLETLARRALVAAALKAVNRYVCARWWFWNFGERNAPLIRCTPPRLEAEAEANRGEPPVVDPEGGGPPTVAATGRPSPQPRGGAGAQRDVRPALGEDGGRGDAHGVEDGRDVRGVPADRVGAASAPGDDPTGGALTRASVPDRDLRRQPYPHEVAAAVDFAAIDVAYEEAADRLDALFLQEWLPSQLAAIADAITYTRRGTARQRITAADMARISAPVEGLEALIEELHAVAVQGSAEALAELGAQGLEVPGPDEAATRALVRDHATAVATQTAEGLSLAAARRAVQLSGAGMTPADLAGEVTTYIEGLEHAWERDQLSGAVQQALNAGRLHVFSAVEVQHSPYASELLDAATCENCRAVDGYQFADITEARTYYPSGGYRECRGGPRCRGTVVVVLGDETPYGSGTIT